MYIPVQSVLLIRGIRDALRTLILGRCHLFLYKELGT